MKLKFCQYAPLEMYFCMVYLFAKVIFWPKTMDYSPWFDFRNPEKVLRKVCHLKKHLKSKLCLSSIAPSDFYDRVTCLSKSAAVTTITPFSFIAEGVWSLA